MTDISKGAMEKKDEEPGRRHRWRRSYPLLKREVELVVGHGRPANARIIPIGSAVNRFLNQHQFEDWLESRQLGAMTPRITHWGDRGYLNVPAADDDFFGQYGDRIRRLAANLLAEVDAAAWWRDHVEGNMAKAFADPRREWQCEWLFEKYRQEFRVIAQLGPVDWTEPTHDGGKGGSSRAWEEKAMQVAGRHGLAHDDKRPQGGCLWIKGGTELGTELKPLGFTFSTKKVAWWRR